MTHVLRKSDELERNTLGENPHEDENQDQGDVSITETPRVANKAQEEWPGTNPVTATEAPSPPQSCGTVSP